MKHRTLVGAALATCLAQPLAAQSRGAHAKTGAKFGALIGVVTGAVIGALSSKMSCITPAHYDPGLESCNATGARITGAIAGGVVLGAAGTALGAVIGAIQPVRHDTTSAASDITAPPHAAGVDRHAEHYPVDSRLRLHLPDPIYGNASSVDFRRP